MRPQAAAKSQARNPKSQTNSKPKIQMTKTVATKCRGWQGSVVIRHAEKSLRQAAGVLSASKRLFVLDIIVLSFGFVSDFVLRIWDFLTCHVRIS
jgi:hypothetical protein